MSKSLHKQVVNYRDNQKINQFLYFLSHNFLFKHFFNEDLVGEYRSKEGLAMAYRCLDVTVRLIKKVIYVMLIAGLSSNEYVFLMVFLLFSLIGALIRDIIKNDFDDYSCLFLLRYPAESYYKHNIIEYLIRESLLLGLAMLYIVAENGLNYLYGLAVILGYLGVHLASQGLTFEALQDHNYQEKEKAWPLILGVVGTAVLVAIILIFQLDGVEILILKYVWWLVDLLYVVIGLLSIFYLWQFKGYNEIASLVLPSKIYKQEDIISGNFNKISNAAMEEKIVFDVKEDHRQGYDYLYHLFLQRFKKTIRKRFIVTDILTAIICFAAIGLSWFFRYSLDGNGLFGRLAVVVFIIYCLSGSCLDFLLNCFMQIDRYLVNYSFFRDSASIAKNLKLRFRTLIVNLLPVGLAISLSLVLILYFTLPGWDLSRMVVAFLLPLIAQIFFILYYLAVYYLLHPYNFEGRSINKVFNVLNAVIYLVVYFLADCDIQLSLPVLGIITIGLTILSIVIYVLTIKLGPKQFRVR